MKIYKYSIRNIWKLENNIMEILKVDPLWELERDGPCIGMDKNIFNSIGLKLLWFFNPNSRGGGGSFSAVVQ